MIIKNFHKYSIKIGSVEAQTKQDVIVESVYGMMMATDKLERAMKPIRRLHRLSNISTKNLRVHLIKRLLSNCYNCNEGPNNHHPS